MSRRKLTVRLITVALALFMAVALSEIVASFYVWKTIPAEQIAAMTRTSSSRGRYRQHAELPYVLNPDFSEHNSYGFKGPEFEQARESDTLRIVCVGGSTTYGGTKPYARFLEDLLREADFSAEVLNAGVPGWTSKENLINLRHRILPLDPDLVIVYQGRNDLIPQAFNGFLSDYSHFRVPNYDFSRTNYVQKKVFRLSRLALVLGTSFPSISGWDSVAEHPVFGTVRYENRPSPEDLIANLKDSFRTAAYRSNTEAMVRLAQDHDIKIVLATFAFLPEKSRFGRFLPESPAIRRSLEVQLDRNNKVLRELADKYSVPVAPTHVLTKESDVFYDDCHVNEDGHLRRAKILFKVLQECMPRVRHSTM